MSRPKDEALGAFCAAMREVSFEALGWVKDNDKLVGSGRAALERSLKQYVVEARRLEVAATRPMSAAVFGPSQAGKSFMIGKFITPPGKDVKVVFGDGTKLDFLSQVNPQGGRETTGLVTRFSINPVGTPPGFPVVLRLLREVDIIKILVNSFVYDLSFTYEAEDLATTEGLSALFEDLESEEGEGDTFRVEDVLELRDYIEASLAKHPLVASNTLSETYWPYAERLLPRLNGEARIRALSPLWGGVPEFDTLYRDLKIALDQLGHPDTVYASLNAIEDTTNGVLHVNRIYEMGEARGPGTELDTLSTAEGKTIKLRRAVITALTAELRITLDTLPWDFLSHTDLLDFPGARSREDSTPARVLRDSSKKAQREYCFLRGKVAVLFDNYVADFDLNTMLLCIAESNLEVRKLPELVQNWVEQTHGKTPSQRQSRATSLFFCMTKSDRFFDIAMGGTPEQSIENRFEVNFKEFPGWTEEWHPNKPFQNTFLLRNPKAIEQEGIFAYEGPKREGDTRPEIGFTEDFDTTTGPVFRKAFLSNEYVVRHVANPEARWDALMALNDGGASHLARELGPVCDPDLKYAQIEPRVAVLSDRIQGALEPFFDDDDIETRVRKRTERAITVINNLITSERLGPFIAELHVPDTALARAYLEFARTGKRRSGAGGSAQTPRRRLGVRGAAPAGEADTPSLARSSDASFGFKAVSTWLDILHRRADDARRAEAYGLSVDCFRTVIEEIEAASARLQLATIVDNHARRVLGISQPPRQTAYAVAVGASLIINEFVNHLGREIIASGSDEDHAAAASACFPVTHAPARGALPCLPENEDDAWAWRDAYLQEWIDVFMDLVRENASTKDGTLVDAEQNARLGALLARLRR